MECVICCSALPWYGVDIGGSLTKIAYFHPENSPTDEKSIQDTFRGISVSEDRSLLRGLYAMSVTSSIDSNRSLPQQCRLVPEFTVDEFLMMRNCRIGGRRGTLHFFRFPSEGLTDAIRVARQHGLHEMTSIICATGGGAEKFGDLIRSVSWGKFPSFLTLASEYSYLSSFKFPSPTRSHHITREGVSLPHPWLSRVSFHHRSSKLISTNATSWPR